MGLVHANITIRNLVKPELKSIVVDSLVDTGALHLCLPKHLAIQMGFDPNTAEKREVTIASGESILCPYIGPLEVSFENRKCFTGALVLGDETLLGAIPMEDMDLIVNPARQQLIANPANPNIPASTAK